MTKDQRKMSKPGIVTEHLISLIAKHVNDNLPMIAMVVS